MVKRWLDLRHAYRTLPGYNNMLMLTDEDGTLYTMPCNISSTASSMSLTKGENYSSSKGLLRPALLVTQGVGFRSEPLSCDVWPEFSKRVEPTCMWRFNKNPTLVRDWPAWENPKINGAPIRLEQLYHSDVIKWTLNNAKKSDKKKESLPSKPIGLFEREVAL